jgi:multiple sugar transport system permease protein
MTTIAGPRAKRPVNVGKIGMWGVMAVVVFITLFPFWWVVRTALIPSPLTLTTATSLLPVQSTLDNFLRVMGLMDPAKAVALGGAGQSINFIVALRNSVFFALAITVSQVFFCAMGAYAFARLQFPLRNILFTLYVSALTIPGIVLLIPNFILMRQLGWIGTFQGMVAPYLLMTPYAVFFMRQFFLGINREIEEAALIDGASRFTTFWRIILPIAQPQVVTLGVITFISAWNDYLWPLIIGGQNTNTRVLTVALGIFRSQTTYGAPDWAGLMSGTTLAIIPTILVFFFMGRRLLDSIGFSGIK